MMSKIEPAKCESMKETPSKFFERALGFVVLVFDHNDTRYFLVILFFSPNPGYDVIGDTNVCFSADMKYLMRSEEKKDKRK